MIFGDKAKMTDKKKEYPYPKGEYVWAGYYTEKHELMFIITSKESSRDYYFLYEYTDGKFKKLGKSSSPRELEKKFEVIKKIRNKTKIPKI